MISNSAAAGAWRGGGNDKHRRWQNVPLSMLNGWQRAAASSIMLMKKTAVTDQMNNQTARIAAIYARRTRHDVWQHEVCARGCSRGGGINAAQSSRNRRL